MPIIFSLLSLQISGSSLVARFLSLDEMAMKRAYLALFPGDYPRWWVYSSTMMRVIARLVSARKRTYDFLESWPHAQYSLEQLTPELIHLCHIPPPRPVVVFSSVQQQSLLPPRIPLVRRGGAEQSASLPGLAPHPAILILPHRSPGRDLVWRQGLVFGRGDCYHGDLGPLAVPRDLS